MIEIEESDLTKTNEKNTFLYKIFREIHDEENSPLQNFILMPVRAAGVVIICYLDNPLMKTVFRFILIAVSISFTLVVLELMESLVFAGIIGLGLGIAMILLELIKMSDNVIKIIYEICSVFAAIGFVSIFSGLIIDFITFLAFYFSLDEVILNSILLSIGNNIGDFFGNGALSKSG